MVRLIKEKWKTCYFNGPDLTEGNINPTWRSAGLSIIGLFLVSIDSGIKADNLLNYLKVDFF